MLSILTKDPTIVAISRFAMLSTKSDFPPICPVWSTVDIRSRIRTIRVDSSRLSCHLQVQINSHTMVWNIHYWPVTIRGKAITGDSCWTALILTVTSSWICDQTMKLLLRSCCCCCWCRWCRCSAGAAASLAPSPRNKEEGRGNYDSKFSVARCTIDTRVHQIVLLWWFCNWKTTSG